ncbi:MAG TPA: acetamidase [Micromonosporaceae bacterium]|nr:acetamidase [Micromonosporaceae bacterium]
MTADSRSGFGYTFGGLQAAAVIDSGDVLTVDTEDCFGGAVTGPSTLPSQVCDLSRVNPVTGPFYVRDAEPGDTLAIHFLSIRPSRDWAVSATFPHFGALTASHDTPMLHQALEERVWRYDLDLDANTARFSATKSAHTAALPITPMHGTVGVAPAGGVVLSTLTSGSHGGNLDTNIITAGTTVYFGMNVAGGMFALGDGHALQGDGELCGVAVECAMTTTLAIEVIKGAATPWPRAETDTELISIGPGRPLDDAARNAGVDMVRWLQLLSGMDELDSMQLFSQIVTLTVGNMCDPAYTVNARVPKRLLPFDTTAVYGGAHQRLRGKPHQT